MDIQVTGLSKCFEDKVVLERFDATFPEGKTTCIMGDSGCGKTTLLNILLGFMEPDEGTVSGLPERIGMVFQEDRLCEDFNAISNIMMAASPPTTKDDARLVLSKMGLTSGLDQPVREFSGGMKRRVAIARALLFDCDLIIFDEAFKGLDAETKERVIACAKEYTQGKTVISVTHDPLEADAFGDYLIRMERP